MNMNKCVFKRAVDVFGERNQIDQCIEECAELIQALNKYKRNRNALANVYEEIADVQIMLAQMRYIFGESNITMVLHDKTDRLERLLDKQTIDTMTEQLKGHCFCCKHRKPYKPLGGEMSVNAIICEKMNFKGIKNRCTEWEWDNGRGVNV